MSDLFMKVKLGKGNAKLPFCKIGLSIKYTEARSGTVMLIRYAMEQH